MARRKKKGRPVSGWLVLDKPAGLGSTEAVSKVRWLFRAQKAGHAGTLDPLASGMLPIALGDATKTVPFVMDGRKIYEFTVRWGEERTTDDVEGAVSESSGKRPDMAEIRARLPAYTGVIEQTPPQFSAVKIDGSRAYDLARDGDAFEIPSREVEIHRLNLIAFPDPDTAIFEVECGKGTYVRALARDMGRDMGCFGHIAALRRSYVAPFGEEDMIPLDELVSLEALESGEDRLAALDARLIDTGEALATLPHLSVNEEQARRLRCGNSVLLRGRDAPLPADEAYATENGRLVAIGEIAQGQFHPRRVFNG
ncbi:MAG: tRNA pseudouridine(55) synthase TruB [Pseudomonadota bacterium]